MKRSRRPEFKTKFETILGNVASSNKSADDSVDTQLCNDFFLLTPDFGVLKAFFLADKSDEPAQKAKAGTLLEKCLRYTSCAPESDVDCIRSRNALEIAFFINGFMQFEQEKVSALLKECAKILAFSPSPTNSTFLSDNEYLISLKHTAVKKFVATISPLKTANSTRDVGSPQKVNEAVISGINIIEPAFDFAAQCLKSNEAPCKDIVLLLAVLISSFSSASYVCAMITRNELLATMLDLLSLCMYNFMHSSETSPDDNSKSSSSFSLWGLLGFSSGTKKDDGKIPDSDFCAIAIPTLFVLRELIRLNQHFKEYAASTMARKEVNSGSTEYDAKRDFPRNFLEVLSYAAENFGNEPDSYVVLTYSLALDALLCLSLDSPRELDAIVTTTYNAVTVHGPAVVLALNSVCKIFSKPINYSLIEMHSKTLTFCQYAINSFFSSAFSADSSDYLFISGSRSNTGSGKASSGISGCTDSVTTADWDTLWKGLFHIIHFIVVVTRQSAISKDKRKKLMFVGKQALEILGVSLVQANRMDPHRPAAVEGLWYEFMRTKAETTQLLSACSEGSEGGGGWWSTGALISAIMCVLNGVIDAYQSTTITMEMVPSIIQETRKQIYSDDKIVSLLQPLEPINPVDDPRDGQNERNMITNVILNNEYTHFSELN